MREIFVAYWRLSEAQETVLTHEVNDIAAQEVEHGTSLRRPASAPSAFVPDPNHLDLLHLHPAPVSPRSRTHPRRHRALSRPAALESRHAQASRPDLVAVRLDRQRGPFAFRFFPFRLALSARLGLSALACYFWPPIFRQVLSLLSPAIVLGCVPISHIPPPEKATSRANAAFSGFPTLDCPGKPAENCARACLTP